MAENCKDPGNVKTRYWMLDSGCLILDGRYQNQRSLIKYPGSSIQYQHINKLDPDKIHEQTRK